MLPIRRLPGKKDVGVARTLANAGAGQVTSWRTVVRVAAERRSRRCPPPVRRRADLVTAVRVVAAGDSLISPSVTRRLIAEFAVRAKKPRPTTELDVLTEREREVMALVAGGLTNDEIADQLYMSPATARTHVSRSMTKVGARDRTQLVVRAYESGLVRPGWLA
jgi:DNA-binding NarL/FixJ family response regulator